MVSLLLSSRYITIHHRDTILLTNRQGWIDGGRTGLYSQDTRYLSVYHLSISGFPPRFLGAARPYYFASSFYYTNPPIGTGPHLIPENSLLLKVSRYIQDGLHEDIELSNYAGKLVQVTVLLSIDADFVDIFQVRGLERVIPGMAQTRWDAANRTLSMHYRKGSFTRGLDYTLSQSMPSPVHSLGAISVELELAHGESWQTCATIGLQQRPAPAHVSTDHLSDFATDIQEWLGSTSSLETPVVHVQGAYNQAVLDLAALRLKKVNEHCSPAAGVPWFVAQFGRDSLITALQTIGVRWPFAVGVIEELAQLQGKKVNEWTEEEPGKIFHELRHGELTVTGKIPYTPYYGTVDASLLYVILLHELFRFTGDENLLRRYYAPAAACLEWARLYGDVDHDGFVEYYQRTPRSYRNQGWKDAFDAVVYPDGSLVDPPIAICEVQGYYYDALRRMVEIARACGHDADARKYAIRARALFKRFNQIFWLEDLDTYAFGLDAHKQPIATVASNPGQLLWSGIVPHDRAYRVAARLMQEDMFSGWGIRTLSAAHPAYDPISYQRGSVWPHDNGIIALGLKRYGLWQVTNRIAEGIFAAAASYEYHSLPEVFSGIERSPASLPVPYYDTNLPQAWAAGSVFMLVRAMLGIEPDPASRRLVLCPALPEWLPELTLRNLKVFDTTLDLRFSGIGPDTTVEILRRKVDIEIHVRQEEACRDSVILE